MSIGLFLGRVLSADGGPAGTCFHAVPGVLVTSWHVLIEAGPAAGVRVASLAPGGGAATARVVRADPVHDLAVLSIGDGVFDAMVDGFAPTGDQEPALPVTAAGVTGLLTGLRTHDGVMVGRMESPAMIAGMSGAPVIRCRDGLVVGVVCGPDYGSARDSALVARVEDLLPLLSDLAAPRVSRTRPAAAIDVTVTVDCDTVLISGQGRRASAAPGPDLPSRGGAGTNRTRDLSPEDEPGSQAAATGHRLTRGVLTGTAGRLFGELMREARAAHRPARVGLRPATELAGLPWEAMLSPASGLPLALDPQVRAFRLAPSAAALRPELPPGPLRILVAISAPLSGSGPVLDYEQELRNILTAVRGARAHRADVRVVSFATTAAIRAALTDYPVHILHLSAHGVPGLILLEDDDGTAREVSADMLLDEAVPPGRMPPVFALAACHTAADSISHAGARARGGAGSFTAGLLARGAGVVIATETSISDGYATRLFAQVYGRLVADPAADAVAAVADARTAVQAELSRSANDRDRQLAAQQEWAAVTVYAPSGSVPIVDLDAPVTTPPVAATRARLLDRAVGEVVGRRREQREWPRVLLAGCTAGIVVHGIGGVGKTTLADEVITRVRENEPERIVATVTGPVSAEQLRIEIARQALDELNGRADRPAGQVLRLLSRLAAGDGGNPDDLLDDLLVQLPILLVLDNFEDNLAGPGSLAVGGALGELLAAVVAKPGRCRLLITCRYRFELPGRADRALTFHHLGPLSMAETLKLAWSHPMLDGLTVGELEAVWRAVGGHPRCLEYVDALLAGGQGRHTDVTLRLAERAERHLRAGGAGPELPDSALDAYLASHTTVDAAIAEAATLAADEVLLDGLLAVAERAPGAGWLMTRASVYRLPVGPEALDPDPAIDTCLNTGLLTPSTAPDGSPRYFVHRWTAAALEKRALEGGSLAHAHALAARYWRSWAAVSTQPIVALQEARHHLTALFRLDPSAGPDELATVCDQLAQALAATGRRQDAAEVSGQHVDLRRRIADNATLAAALDQHGTHLAAAGRPQKALEAAIEAVAAYRRLTGLDAELAGALGNLGARLADSGRPGDAIGATILAVSLYRRLYAGDPYRHGPGLATALNNLGADLATLNRLDEALAAAAESVVLHRRLGDEPGLAMALNNLGNRLSRAGHPETALSDAAAEAVAMYQRLAVTDPAAYEHRLAAVLGNLGALLADLGRQADSVVAASAAAEIQRRLAAADPVAFGGALTGLLTALAEARTALLNGSSR